MADSVTTPTPAEHAIRCAIWARSIGRDSFMLIDGREVYYRDVLAAFGLEKIDGWSPTAQPDAGVSLPIVAWGVQAPSGFVAGYPSKLEAERSRPQIEGWRVVPLSISHEMEQNNG